MTGRRTDTALRKVAELEQRQKQFDELCILMRKQLATLPLGIVVEDGKGVIRNLTVAGYPCRMRLGIRERESDQLLGKITFERVLSATNSRSLFTVFFDQYGNGGEEVGNSWPYSLADPSTTYEWFGVRLVETFLRDLAGEDAGNGVAAMTRVPIGGI